MSLLGEIRSKLAATSAVASLVPAERILQEKSPQGGSYPAIVVTSPDTEHGHDLSGAAGYADVSVDVHIWSRNTTDRDNVTEQVRLALVGYSGLLTTLRTQGITLEDDTANWESDRMGGQNGFFHRVLRFMVMSAEAVPT